MKKTRELRTRIFTLQSTREEALAALPAEWVESLKQGARLANFILLSSVIEQIREQNVSLADALAQLAEDFEYKKILTLLQTNRA